MKLKHETDADGVRGGDNAQGQDPPTVDRREEKSRSSNTKIDRIIEKYGLDGIREELGRRWTSEENRDSLRDLESYFNRHVLRAAVEEVGTIPLDGEVENIYRLLTEDDVQESNRTHARRRLEREGVDVDQVCSDFVSHQTIYRYLTNHLEVESPEEEKAGDESYVERVRALQNRTKVVTKDVVKRLQDDDLDEDELDVLVDVKIRCPECGQYHRIDHFVEETECSTPLIA